MRTKILIAALMFALEGGAARAVEPEKIPAGVSEPTKCFRMLGQSDFNLTVGTVLELCAGAVFRRKDGLVLRRGIRTQI